MLNIFCKKSLCIISEVFLPKRLAEKHLHKDTFKAFAFGVLYGAGLCAAVNIPGVPPSSGRHPWRADDFLKTLSCCIGVLLSSLREAPLDPTSYEQELREGQDGPAQASCVTPGLVGGGRRACTPGTTDSSHKHCLL